MITYNQVGRDRLGLYDSIPMCVEIKSYLKIEKLNRGLGGFSFVETPIEPHVKDFRTDHETSMAKDAERFDISNWAFFIAYDGEKPVGGAAVASRTKEVNLLRGRDDLALLWDIRVDDDYKGRGIGQGLFDLAVGWSRSNGLKQMQIECQNNNVPACRFYYKQGAVLTAVDEYAYYDEPEYRHEVRFIWTLDL